MLLNPISSLTSRSQGSEHSRVAKATQDFEALLLTSLLAPLEKSFSAVPGESSAPAGSEDYGYMGVQALASSPPPSLEVGPSSPSPGDDDFYTPGQWVFQNGEWVWQPGQSGAQVGRWKWLAGGAGFERAVEKC